MRVFIHSIMLLAAAYDTTSPIEDRPTPYTGVFDSGSWSIVCLALATLAFFSFLILAAILLSRYFKYTASPAAVADEQANPAAQEFLFSGWLPWMVISAVAAMLSIFLFAFSQDFNGVLVIYDFWSLILLVLYIVQIYAMAMALRRSSDPQRTSADTEIDDSQRPGDPPSPRPRLSLRTDELGGPANDSQPEA